MARSPYAIRFAGIAGALIAWEIGGRIVGSAFLAPPSEVVPEFFRMLAEGQMPLALALSLRQMLLGFGVACLIGMPLGVLMGRSRVADMVFHPWVSMFVVMSVAALVPLFIVLIGTGFMFRFAIVFFASVWYVVLTMYHGARGIPPRYIDVARSFGMPRLQTFRKVLMPALFPYVVTSLRLGFVHALRGMVVAEMFVLVGFGDLIHQTGLDMSTAPLLALLLALMIVSVGANALFQWAGRRIAPWYSQRTALNP